MHTLVLSTLLFHGLGTVAIMLGAVVNSLLPERRAARTWELADASGVAGGAVRASARPGDHMELPRAA